MVTMQPPPAYSGDQAAPPAYPTQAGGKNKAVYWAYWGVLFGTVLTWVFTVSAAADDAWFTINGVSLGGFEGDCIGDAYGDGEFCGLYTGAKAFQILATLLVSVIMVLVFVAAFMKAPITGKMGLAAGIGLAVTALLQLIAFSLMAAIAEKYHVSSFFGSYDIKLGATFGVAVVAWLLDTAGAIATLVLLKRATADQDGPFTACMAKAQAGGANAGAPPASVRAGQPGVPVVGTV